MHARSWLTLASLPLVGVFSLPILQPQAPAKPKAAAATQDPLAGLADIQDVLALVQRDYVDSPDMEKVVGGGIQAVLERAHPLNSLLSTEDLRLPDPGPADAGFRYMKRGAGGLYAQVTAVIPGGPAAQAGLQVGDVIRKVDGESVGLLSTFQLERRLRGTEGSVLQLSKYTVTGELTKVSVTRRTLQSGAITLTPDKDLLRAALPDLRPGRAQELAKALEGKDPKLGIVLDLRGCFEGTYEEAAQVAALFAQGGLFGTLQEAGKPENALGLPARASLGFKHVGLLIGAATQGPAEVLAACLKKAGLPVEGERSLGLALTRTRVLLRQGGAVELVNGRWVGAGGEKLDRQGVTPTDVVRAQKPDEDLLPRYQDQLRKRIFPPDKKVP
jgi:carboxyl-terminal processing protease